MPREEKPVLERARAEIAAGRLWKARDRLTGALSGDPYDQAVLDLLGSVYFQLGDHPAAGRCWFLGERSGEEAELARKALEKRRGGDAIGLLQELPLGYQLERYPPVVRERIGPLVERAHQRGYELRGEPVAELVRKAPPFLNRLGCAIGSIVLVLATVGIWLLGFVKLIGG